MPLKSQRGPDLLLCGTLSVLLLFVVCTTVYMVLQSRQTVAQSNKIDELERQVKQLVNRVVDLETLLASKGKLEDDESTDQIKVRLV